MLINKNVGRLTSDENQKSTNDEWKKNDETSECSRTIEIRYGVSNFHTGNTKTKNDEYYS